MPAEAVICDEKVFAPANVCTPVVTDPATVAEAFEIARVISSGVDAPTNVQVVPVTVPVAATSKKLASAAAEEFTVMLSPLPPLPQAAAATEITPELFVCKQSVPPPASDAEVIAP